MYGDIIPQLEADSRGVFLDALRAAGFQGEKPQLRTPQPPDEAIEDLLGKVDFVAQYGAVRAAHQAISAHGETPEWLGDLVRGYANLAAADPTPLEFGHRGVHRSVVVVCPAADGVQSGGRPGAMALRVCLGIGRYAPLCPG